MDKTVVELFAGVGGFRVGLNNIRRIEDGKAVEDGSFDFVWANQYEPSSTVQHAYECYRQRFGDNISNTDIALVDKSTIPDHSLLVGGFPCQNYSVSASLKHSNAGIYGKKGVLWWQINEILSVKKSPFVLLENVDRLLHSPAIQRGRDMGILLRCMADLGYTVEWRVINSADYGMPQRRRRTFIFAYRNDTRHSEEMGRYGSEEILTEYGLFPKNFPISSHKSVRSCTLGDYEDLVDVSDRFAFDFGTAGIMRNGEIATADTSPLQEVPTTLGQIAESDVDEHYYLDDEKLSKFEYLRGSKKIPRVKPDGTPYMYTEGAMSPYDDLSLPSRTMLTSEGSVNRSTHILKDPSTGRMRILTPIECERLQMFPDGWTDTMTEKRRYFMMGNALVTGIVSRLGKDIGEIISRE